MKFSPNFYQKHDMIAISRDTLDFFGGVRTYLNHINALLDATYVCMMYEGDIYILPLHQSLCVFSKGGVFVNE